MSTLISRTTGIAHTAPKQGDKLESRNAASIAARNAARDICLNCTRPECNGCGSSNPRFSWSGRN